MPHRAALLSTCVLVLAACGSSDESSTATVATASPRTTDVAGASSSTVAPTSTTVHGAADAEAANADQVPPLSIQGTLLPDEAFPMPWEPKRRTYDNITVDDGPFQSSCAGYEVAERFVGRAEATMFWWVDGGNANHYVGREAYPGEGEEFVAAVADAAAECGGVVSWGEGGSMQIESLDLGEGVAGFSMVTYPGDDLGYVAATTYGDLISVLWVPMWTNNAGEFPDLTTDDFADVAQDTLALLHAAKPAMPDELLPETTTTLPGTRPDPTTIPRPIATTTTVPPSGLALLLLAPADLGAEWWSEAIEPHTPAPAEPGFVEACPVAASVDDADRVLEWGVELERDDGVNLGQLIGRADDAATAADIAGQFARLIDCDLSEQFGDTVTYSGGPVVIEGASAAGEVAFTSDDGTLVSTTVLAAVGDLLIAVGVDPGFGTADESADDIRALTLDLVGQAVAKAAAG